MMFLTGNQKKSIFIVLVSLSVYSLLCLLSGLKFEIEIISSIIFTRLIFLSVLSRDSGVSWEKSSSSIYITKLVYSFLSLLTYYLIISIFWTAEFAFLLFDFALFTLILNSAVSFKRISFSNSSNFGRAVAIYGAGSAGIGLYKNLREKGYLVKVFIDDDHIVRQNTIDSIKVISLDVFISKQDVYAVDEVIIAMPSLSNAKIVNKYDQLGKFGGEIKMLPPLEEILSDRSLSQQIENVSLDKFMARHSRGLDINSIHDFIKHKIVLISGAGGSIGSELARQCVNADSKLIILLDHSEYNLYEICEELVEFPIVPVLLSVTKSEEIGEVFSMYKPDIVLHAAAYKHVPLCEENVDSAIDNNIVGTMNLINQSIAYDVGHFVLVSTDKAVRPTNVMGTTKRICELYGQNIESKSTKIISVRFGNVLGSSGSVIPKFIKQINSGGPITVTHPDITRYFMLTSEACALVLQAASSGRGGEVYILDMGEPVKITDLAKRMIALSGNKDISIVYTGLRPGEKLYEELLIDDSVEKTSCKQIMIAKHTVFDIKSLNALISKLLISSDKLSVLKEIVPEFKHKQNK